MRNSALLRTALLFTALLAAMYITACDNNKKQSVKRTGNTSFTLKDTNGNSISLSDYMGKVVLLEFWATWCPPCRLAVPELNELHKKLEKMGVVFLSVSVDESRNDVIDFIKEMGVEYPVLIDDQDINDNYGVTSIPVVFFIDQQGKVVKKHMGFSEGISDYFETEAKNMLKSGGQ